MMIITTGVRWPSHSIFSRTVKPSCNQSINHSASYEQTDQRSELQESDAKAKEQT